MLNCWPRGFYKAGHAVKDAQRRGWGQAHRRGRQRLAVHAGTEAGGGARLRLGLRYGGGLREAGGKRIVEERVRAAVRQHRGSRGGRGCGGTSWRARRRSARGAVPARAGGGLPTRGRRSGQAGSGVAAGVRPVRAGEPREDEALMSDPVASVVTGGPGLPRSLRGQRKLPSAHVNEAPARPRDQALRTFGESRSGQLVRDEFEKRRLTARAARCRR